VGSNQALQYTFLVVDYCGRKRHFRTKHQFNRLREDVEHFAGFVYPSGSEVVLDFSSVRNISPSVAMKLVRWFRSPEFNMLRLTVKSASARLESISER
jgi:hypothetical protein